MKRSIKNFIIILLLFLIAFFICIQSPINIFNRNLSSETDSSVFRYIGWSITKGYVPYLQLFDHKGILLYFINYIGELISPNVGVWLIELSFMFVSVAFTYKISRKFVSKKFSILITIMTFIPMYKYFEGGNLCEEYALPFQIIALDIFLDFFLNPKKYGSDFYTDKKSIIITNFKWFNIQVCICGVCFASVIFLRPNMIAVWAAFCIMVLIYCLANKEYKDLIKFIISFLIGILLICIPVFIYLLKNNALESFINDYIIFNLKYSSDANPSIKSRINCFIIFSKTAMLALIIMIVKLCNQLKNKEKYYFNLGYFCYIIMTLILICIAGNEYRHYGMTLIPALIYPYCIFHQFIEEKWNKNLWIILKIVIIILYIFVAQFCFKFIRDGINIIQHRNWSEYTSDVIEYITSNVREDETISVFGNRDYIYYYSKRQSASKYSYQTPISTIDRLIIDEYFNDLKNNKPKLIIWTNVSEDSDIGKIMEKFLQENGYKLAKSGKIKIYK